MTKIILCGVNGKMGGVVVGSAAVNDNCEIVCGVDAYGENNYDFPTYKSASTGNGQTKLLKF